MQLAVIAKQYSITITVLGGKIVLYSIRADSKKFLLKHPESKGRCIGSSYLNEISNV